MKLSLVDAALEKYGLPPWMKKYVYAYLKGNTVQGIRRAASFINVGRKKGIVTKKEIVLPNGTTFKREQILHLVSLFFYGEERIGSISKAWAATGSDLDPQHRRHFEEMAAIESRRARAIKNLVEGLGHRVEKPTKELVEVFDYIQSLRDWDERIVTKKLLLSYSYAKPFGYVFYKIFYPVSPEFMRSFGTAFNSRQEEELIGEEDAEEVVRSGEMHKERLMELAENVLARVTRSVDAELPKARASKIEREVMLLRDISIAYPLHRLNELGADIDVDKEVAQIKRLSKSKNFGSKNKSE